MSDTRVSHHISFIYPHVMENAAPREEAALWDCTSLSCKASPLIAHSHMTRLFRSIQTRIAERPLTFAPKRPCSFCADIAEHVECRFRKPSAARYCRASSPGCAQRGATFPLCRHNLGCPMSESPPMCIKEQPAAFVPTSWKKLDLGARSLRFGPCSTILKRSSLENEVQHLCEHVEHKFYTDRSAPPDPAGWPLAEGWGGMGEWLAAGRQAGGGKRTHRQARSL